MRFFKKKKKSFDKINNLNKKGVYAILVKLIKKILGRRTISKCQPLNEELIKKFKDSIDWEEISKHQKSSEDFIR